jgi:hypothetical protein
VTAIGRGVRDRPAGICHHVESFSLDLILRSRTDVVSTWDDTEVARRWLLICPVRKNSAGDPAEPNEFELNSIRNDPRKLETIRLRLSDLGWWMRVLCQYIAVRANREDHELGKFWQSRFRAVRLLDEAALLACAAYVDLNPIRAAMAETLEQSHYTSVQRRIQSFSPTNDNSTSATLATNQPKQECKVNLVGAVILAAKRLLRGCRRLPYRPESPQIGFCHRLR